jgi:5-amino-6-(5-phosphoribosylamino)uracil reductase
MNQIPYVVLKCAMSIDGFIDDSSHERLILSNPEDFDRVDQVRSSCDAILVGAGTIRADNPTLLVRSAERQQQRVLRGLLPSPAKVTITHSGSLDPEAHFFTMGDVPKVVYCSPSTQGGLSKALQSKAEVVAAPNEEIAPRFIVEDLAKRQVNRLLIEGGSSIATMFLSAGLVDELQVSIAPFFVGEANAPRFVNPARFPHDTNARMRLQSVEQVGDMAVLTFHLNKLVS